MGSPPAEAGRFDDEGPQHEVTLTRGFWLGEAPVTQRQWVALAGQNPSKFNGDDLPVEHVSWEDCRAWMTVANSQVAGLGLRLPMEAEWEYACRAGSTGPAYRGLNSQQSIDELAWTETNSGGMPQPVGRKAPNAWGLFDTLGNVWEWCEDSQRKYTRAPVTDPRCEPRVEVVFRGGSWGSSARLVRPAFRNARAPVIREGTIGFRLARDA